MGASVKVASGCKDAGAMDEGLPWLLCSVKVSPGFCLTFSDGSEIVR